MLWYISIFHPDAQAIILGADCSCISSNGFAKYFESYCAIINDRREYKAVETIHVASIIFAIRFCPWKDMC